MLIVCDLDGVIRLGSEPIPGSAEAVSRLRDAGHEVVFVTNNAAVPIAQQEARLAEQGIPAVGQVIGAALAAASMIPTGSNVLVVGEAGLIEAVEAKGARVVEPDGSDVVDVVIVGLDRCFDYDRMRTAASVIRGGARFIATNTDATFPTPDGLVPGAGSLVVAVASASGTEPEIAGKPHEPTADLIRDHSSDDDILVVGDRDDTDGELARRMGARFALVLSGVTGPDELPDEHIPDHVADDLVALVDQIL